MKQLIEDYKRRLKNINEVIKDFKSNGGENDLKKAERLNTKASEYRTFIVELERIERNVQIPIPTGMLDKNNKMLYENDILPDQTPKLVSLIDFNMLKEQKASLNYVIDYLETEQIIGTASNNLIGLLNLIDSIQDFAVDVMGLNPIDVFDFEFEENREDVVKPAKIIGYQVLSNTNDCALHPKMEASFCLYSLKQCKKIVGGETENWKIQTYRSGDIEGPTMMFHNSPDNNHKK
jgi:hypothetical protein